MDVYIEERDLCSAGSQQGGAGRPNTRSRAGDNGDLTVESWIVQNRTSCVYLSKSASQAFPWLVPGEVDVVRLRAVRHFGAAWTSINCVREIENWLF